MSTAPQTQKGNASAAETLKDVAGKTDWRIYKANDQEKSPIEHAMDKFHRRDKTDPIDFFLAWSIQPSVIAERLRRLGYDVSSKHIDDIIHVGIRNKMEFSMLTVVMMELLNDVNKTLYKTNRL